MEFDLIKIVQKMNIFAILVASALGLMAVLALSIFVERWWAYFRSRRRSRAFGPTAARLLQANDHAGLLRACKDARPSYLTSMLGFGMQTYLKAVEKPGDVPPVELVRRELARRGDAQSAQLKRGLNILASIGSTAPFVGLLGTVIGIIAAFQGIATEGSGNMSAIAGGISEALVVTAFGLMVAIPSVLIFNYLTGKADGILLALDQARGELVDHLEAHHTESVGRGKANVRTVVDAA
jgi:biopolymer transport protein ExbB